MRRVPPQGNGGRVVEFEQSRHSAGGVTCLDCYAPHKGQTATDHRGFTIAERITPKNCSQCHPTEHQQFQRSRHAARDLMRKQEARLAGRVEYAT